MHHTQILKKSINAIRKLKKKIVTAKPPRQVENCCLGGDEEKLPLKGNFPLHILVIDDGRAG